MVRVNEISQVFLNVFKDYEGSPIYQFRDLNTKIKDLTLMNERIILKELGFELFRIEIAHRFIWHIVNLLKLN